MSALFTIKGGEWLLANWLELGIEQFPARSHIYGKGIVPMGFTLNCRMNGLN